MIVSFAKVFTLVLETKLEPGSLKAMWPSGPIPDTRQQDYFEFYHSTNNDGNILG